MLEEHIEVAVNCSRTNMSDKQQRQPTNISNTNMAQIGPSNRASSCTPNEVKVNTSKDASNGAVTKSNRAPRYGGGRRRGSKGVGIKGDWNHQSGAGPTNASPYENTQQTKRQNFRKYQNVPGNNEVPTRQPNYSPNNNTVTKEDEFEAGSVYNWNDGSKKQNLNHLLNFQYEPRGNKNKLQRNNRSRFQEGTTGKGVYYTRRPTYKKEQYLQANCQFVVRKGPDYTLHLKNPDVIVDWDLIEQVRLKTTSDVPSCPICLYPPTTAKITKCGHVYCWTCILHYLSLSDDQWRKCPICFDSIRRGDLKSVVSIPWKEIKTNGEIDMQLMRRERNSLFAFPVADYNKYVDIKGHPEMNSNNNSYSQLILASPEQVHRYITSKEQGELEHKYIELKETDDPTICYVEEALNYLTERQDCIIRKLSEASDTSNESLNQDFNDNLNPSSDTECWTKSLEKDSAGSDSRPRPASSSSDGMSCSEMESGDTFEEPVITAEDLDISTLQPVDDCKDNCTYSGASFSKETKYLPSNKPKETFYFYQSSDGQAIFLHALNVQMLVKEYGSFEACPTVIKGVILEKDGANMSDELRNKLRYLKHLPVTSSFEVAELALKQPLISKETMAMFRAQLDERQRRRAKRGRAEKRREKRIEVEENKLMGKFPGAGKSLRIESEFHFPAVGTATGLNVFGSTPSHIRRSSESLVDSLDSRTMSPQFDMHLAEGRKVHDPIVELPGTHVSISNHEEASSGGMSFAKMLREGAAKPNKPLENVQKSETFPGQNFVTLMKKSARSDSEPEPEDYVPPPPKQTIGDALAQALKQACTLDVTSKGNDGSTNSGAPGSGKKKSKKMKGKKISLFSAARPNI